MQSSSQAAHGLKNLHQNSPILCSMRGTTKQESCDPIIIIKVDSDKTHQHFYPVRAPLMWIMVAEQ